MLLSSMNLNKLHHLVYRMRALRFELALLQEKILTLEFDHGTLAENRSEDDNICPTIEFPSAPRSMIM
jgi:hypothetical protein